MCAARRISILLSLFIVAPAGAESRPAPDTPPSPCRCDRDCYGVYQVCQRGICRYSNEGTGTPCPPCQAPLSECAGACFDLTSDDQNCGGCGHNCGDEWSDFSCVKGSCVCARGTVCGGRCVDLDNNERHCGGCGSACAEGEYCVRGRCSCSSYERKCSGSCINPMLDRKHCGSCDNACGLSQDCVGGRCEDVVDASRVTVHDAKSTAPRDAGPTRQPLVGPSPAARKGCAISAHPSDRAPLLLVLLTLLWPRRRRRDRSPLRQRHGR